MAVNLRKKINKLLLALQKKKHRYAIDTYQFWSEDKQKMITVRKLIKIFTSEEWNNKYHNKKPKDTNKVKWVKENVLDSSKDIDILRELIKVYKAGGSSG